jgi:hypothetical protein
MVALLLLFGGYGLIYALMMSSISTPSQPKTR